MIKYILRRLIQAVPTFLGITILSYMIMWAAPGDPVSLMTFDPTIKQETKERLADQLGVNDPLPIQYLRWLIGDEWKVVDENGDGVPDERPTDGITRVRYGILRGDFGDSFYLRQDALELIIQRIPATLELSVTALIVSLTIGLPLGILAAVWRGGWFDQFTRVGAVVGNAVPGFWMGIMLILFFGAVLGVLPMGDRGCPTRGECTPLYMRLDHLILPTVVLSLGGIAGYSRYMRASMLEQINSDYIRTARAKGLPNRLVWFKHGAKNALIPIATFLGPTLTGLIGGAVITETIFSWPGMGRLLVAALTRRDYPIVMAGVVVGSILTILGYIISDVLYAVVDPRIRF